MLRIGLTGGIGSGKSTVARLFQARGVPVVDTDALAREVVRPGQPALRELTAAFGPAILTPDGHLDRARLREIAFTDAGARARLEAILHPYVFAALARRLQNLDAPYVVIAIPLLVETGARDRVDRVLVVDCPESLQIQRVRRRSGWDEALIRRVMAAQASRRERLAVADDVVVNDAGLEALARQVEELHHHYLRLSAERNDP